MKNPAGASVFGVHLQRIRERHKFGQQALADTANIDRSTLYRIEVGQITPTLDVLISISRALGISVSELTDCSGLMEADSGL